MYAMIATGGKQYKAIPGETLIIEKIDAEEGQDIELNDVLLVSNGENLQVGKPFVEGAKVIATVEKHFKDNKVEVLKFKRRKHHMKRQGHRQNLIKVLIKDIQS